VELPLGQHEDVQSGSPGDLRIAVHVHGEGPRCDYWLARVEDAAGRVCTQTISKTRLPSIAALALHTVAHVPPPLPPRR